LLKKQDFAALPCRPDLKVRGSFPFGQEKPQTWCLVALMSDIIIALEGRGFSPALEFLHLPHPI
jgi:hypothetical protein